MDGGDGRWISPLSAPCSEHILVGGFEMTVFLSVSSFTRQSELGECGENIGAVLAC